MILDFRILDFLISSIDQDSGFSLDLGFKTGLFQGLESVGFSSDVGFWFFFGSFYNGFSGFGFESLIDQLTIQTYDTGATGTRE
jgi:hypothetical protein